jgi:tetratricopeptide (TPR) repeat protein
VPKFTSFTAKRPPRLDTARNRVSLPKENGDSARRIHQRREHRSRNSSQRYRQDEPHKNPLGDDEILKSAPVTSNRTSSRDIFIVDTKGDPSNVVYGGASRWSVPKYARRGAGRVVGAGLGVRINKDGSTDRYIVLDDNSKIFDSARTGLGQRRLKIPAAKRLIPDGEQQPELDADFISLGEKRTTSKIREGILEQVRDLDQMDILSDHESQQDVESDHADEKETSIIERHAELNRLTRLNPQKLEYWLQLIEHQESMLRLGHASIGSPLNREERTRLADIRISIYEEALRKTREQKDDQETLWVGMLTEVTLAHEFETIVRKWKSALETCPESIKIRINKLDFIQTHYLRIGLCDCKNHFLEVLTFIKKRFEVERDSDACIFLCYTQAYSFLRLTSFLKASGYREQAFALWQAALDFIIFPPAFERLEDALVSFGDFWDSEALRLGEGPNGGWKQHLFATEPQIPEGRQNFADSSDIARETPLKRLVRQERKLDETLSLPGKTLDEYDDNDTYHMVMFSDLHQFLSTLILDSKAQAALLLAFLCFFGIPALPSTPTQYLCWWLDPFLHRSQDNIWKENASLQDHCLSFPTSFGSKLPDISSMIEEAASFPTCTESEVKVVLEILRVLVIKFDGNEELAIAFIAFILRHKGPNLAAKEIKKLMKLRSTIVSLYNAYYILEERRGNTDSAVKVISTPIKLKSSLPEQQLKNLVILWHTWIWHNFTANNIEICIHLLMSLDADQVVASVKEHSSLLQLNATSVLKSRQWVQQGQHSSLHRKDVSNFALFTDIGMLLSYFENGQSLMSAVEYAERSMGPIHPSKSEFSRAIELIHQSRTSIISRHAKYVRPYVPAQIKELLHESMSLFPQNTIFLEEYANQDLSFGLNDRLRNILPISFQSESQDSIPNWLFAIWFVYRRYLEMGGEPHAVRATLDRTIESHSGKYSSTLWLLYLRFEKVHGSAVTFRTVLHAASTRLPWVKDILMEGLEYLDEKTSDIESLYNLLEEREIRMHQELP